MSLNLGNQKIGQIYLGDIPLCGGGKDELYTALQYSGLVTPEMSYEEMLEALKNYWPERITLLPGNPYNIRNSSYGQYKYAHALVKNDTELSMQYYASGSNLNIVYYFDAIDLTLYDRLYIEYSPIFTLNHSSSSYARICVSDDRMAPDIESEDLKYFQRSVGSDLNVFWNSREWISDTIDISQMTSKGRFLGIHIYTGGYTTFSIRKMELLAKYEK